MAGSFTHTESWSFQNTVELLLDNNDFTGPLPDLSENKKIVTIDLSFNRLTGGIETNIFELEELRLLYLDNNLLTGDIPQNFGNNENLVDLYLNDNNFSGSIPSVEVGSSTLQNISKYTSHSCGDNFRSVPVLTLFSLSGTDELLLQRNNFVGEVPQSLCDLRARINEETDPDQFRRLRTDCAPNEVGAVQNFCPQGCCDRCFVGKEVEP